MPAWQCCTRSIPVQSAQRPKHALALWTRSGLMPSEGVSPKTSEPPPIPAQPQLRLLIETAPHEQLSSHTMTHTNLTTQT